MKVGKRLAIFAWGMYGFANTMFAMNVITLYFALWVVIDMKGQDIFYSYAMSGSMLLFAVTAPIFGAISDRISRRIPFLLIFTLICCFFTALITFTHQLLWGLIFFAIANYCFQIGDMFNNSLLALVSSEKDAGRVSGYGMSMSYLGTVVGLLIVSPFALKYGRQITFLPTAVFFLIFAIPCFLFVKDKVAKQPMQGSNWKVGKNALFKVKDTITHMRSYPGLLSFLLSVFFSFNAINTIFVFVSVYSKKVEGFHDKEIILFYIISSLFAVLGSFISGFVSDRIGSKRTLTGVLVVWCVAICIAAVTSNQWVFWMIGPLVGMALGATWTSSRALALELSPPEMIAEVFGFYGLAGKTASIIGPLVWGVSVWAFASLGVLRYRIAIVALLIFLVLGLVMLQRVPNKKS